MPERLSSLAFWVIFTGIILAVAYPTLEAMRDDQPNVTPSPSPISVGARGPVALPVARRSPAVPRSPVAAHRPIAVRSPIPTRSPVAVRSPVAARSPVAVRSPNVPWPYSRSPVALRRPNLPWPYSQSVLASNSNAAAGQRSLPSAPPTRPPERRRYDDTDFAYSGHWEHVRRRNDGGTSGGSSRSFHPGSQATLTFDGRSVRLYGVVGPGGGLGVVSIDGRQQEFVKFYAPVRSAHMLIYSSPQLPPGPHRVTISVVADPTLQTTRQRYVNISGADI